MQLIRLAFLFFLFLLWSSAPGLARCQGAVMLGGLHDAYLATLTETGATRTSGARTFMVLIGGRSAQSMALQLRSAGSAVDVDRLRSVMADGERLARDVLSGLPPPQDQTQHSRNVDWLGSVFANTGCVRPPSTTGNKTTPGIPNKLARLRKSSTPAADNSISIPIVQIAATLVAIAGLGLGIHLLRTSLRYRIHMAERLPRIPIAFMLDVTFTNAQGRTEKVSVRAMDISAGGMKLGWEDPAPSGTLITLSMPFGERLARIVWSNAYYAGTMFEDHLSNSELKKLT